MALYNYVFMNLIKPAYREISYGIVDIKFVNRHSTSSSSLMEIEKVNKVDSK